ncbi:MAG: hypothetical protein EHM58_01150 [Ignavibacteriae bacterium]|nr:MAG: hypothetical protein EHM58_01150 [Ignavibacteriota bacterium]
MNYIELNNSLKNFLVFSINDIEKVEPSFHKQRLSEWQEKNYIKKIVKGKYIFSDVPVNDYTLFYIANKIYGPSYISLESALSYYNLIPEAVYLLTSVCTRRTYNFDTTLGSFSYRQIKKNLFFGYINISFNNYSFKIAEPEKAVIDYMYLNSHIDNINHFIELRINKDEFCNIIEFEKVYNYLSIIKNKKLDIRIKKFLKYIQNA